MSPKARRGASSTRRRRWLFIIALAVVLLLGAGFAVLRVKFEGPDLGDKLASILNKRMRGRIEIGAVEWPTSALETVVTGGWVPLTLRDVKVWDDCALSAGASGADPDELRIEDPNQDCTADDRPDPDPKSKRKPRRLLLDAPLLTTEIDIHAVLFGNHDLVFRNLWIRGGEALIEQTAEPYPLHAYNRTIVSIVTAFYPRMKAGFRAGIYADSSPPVFDLRDIHVKDLNLTIHVGPYENRDSTIGFGLAARIVGVDIDADEAHLAHDAYLYMDPTDPLVTKFYVRLGLRGKHGSLRILDEGPRAAFHVPGSQGLGDAWGKGRRAKYEIELSEIAIKRLAQLPTEWPRKDYVANTIEIDGSAHTVACKSERGAPSDKDGADLHFNGEILNYWDRPYDGQWNFKLDVKNFGPTLRTCIKSAMGGDNLGGTISLQGPFVAMPKVVLDLHGLDYDLELSTKQEPVQLTLAEIHGEIDLVNETGYIDKTKALVRGGKDAGEVMVSATFGLKPVILHADIDITRPIDVGRFLPPKVAAAVGKFVAGKLTINGDIEYGFELKDFDLGLGSEHQRDLRLFSGRIFTKNVFDTVDIEKVKFEAGKSHATIDGGIEYTNNDHYEYRNLKIEGDYQDLDVWLRRFGLPAIIKSAGGGTIILNGPITQPTINAQTTLAGIPCIDTMRIVNSRLKDNVLDIEVSTAGLGGALTGKARLLLDPNRAPMIESLDVTGGKLEASRLCGLKGVKGTIDTANISVAHVSVDNNRSAMDWMRYAKVTANAEHLTLYGDAYSSFALCVNAKDDSKCRPDLQRARLDGDDLLQCGMAKAGGFCAVATASRDLGGQLDATVASLPAIKAAKGKGTPAKLGGTIALDNVPLAVVDQIVGASTIGGVVSAAFHLQGTPNAPQADGNIDILRSWALGAFIGDLHPQIDPVMIGKIPGIQIRGSGMSGNLEISAMVGTQAPYPVQLEIKTHRLEIDSFIDLSKKLGLSEPVQAWMTAVVTVNTELAPLGGKPATPDAWVEIQELEAYVDHRAKDGRRAELRFELVAPEESGKNAMSLHVTPTTIELACRDPRAPGGRVPCPARLDTPAGIVSLEGNASQTQMALSAHGTLDLKRLGPLVETQFDAITGTIDLDARISGTIDKPRYEVSLGEFKDLSLRPAGGDTELQVQTGQIKLANGSLGFNNVTLNVKDEHRDEQGKLVLRGGIALDGLTPTKWGVLIGGPDPEPGKQAEPGRIAGKMLLVIAPGAISQASGLARIDGDLTLSGTGLLPLVNGTLTFDPIPGQRPTPFAFIPRGVRREISMLGGSIEVSTTTSGSSRTYTLSVEDNPLTTSIDGEGKLQNIHGNVVLTNGVLDHASMQLDAGSIPFRTTDGALDLVLSAKDVSLVLPSAKAAWIASGNVSIISGEYKRNFELTEVLKPTPTSTAPAKPFWDEYPSIGNAQLGLTLDIGKFSVQNNIASIDLVGSQILITGSPRDPRLAGSIRVQRGEFRIPGTRAHFTRTSGSIDFTEIQKASNPALAITADDPDYFDLSGQQHTITLSIFGTLETPQIDLRTSTGLDRSQTLALLLLGRSPEQLRRSLGDQALGRDPTRVDPTTNPSGGVGDQIVKDLAGDWVSSLIGDSISKLTGLDVLRFQVGFGSVSVHAEKKMAENIKLLGDGELGSRGQTINARFEVRTPYHVMVNDRFSLQGGYLNKNYFDPAEIDISDLQGKLVYRLFIP